MRDSLLIHMLLSVVSVLVVAQSSSEVPEGLMNNPVLVRLSAVQLINKLCVDDPEDSLKVQSTCYTSDVVKQVSFIRK